MSLLFTGISDEGAASLEEQIRLHKELGWQSLEIRGIDGVNISEMSDEAFEKVCTLLDNENMRVAGFASAIANWARPVTGDFEIDRRDLLCSAPRMHRLGTPFLRIMSYARGEADEKTWSVESVRRVAELSRMAEGEGIILIHENCDGWASAEPENLARLLDSVPSDALKIVFDMGNPRSHGHEIDKVWKFLKACEDRIAHIHIKDCYLDEKGEAVHCFPGEGECRVKETVEYMIREKGYKGLLSIEPHMVFQFHKGPAPADADQKKAENYLEYGRRSMALLGTL